jgi:rSAM/selenodomain-associated transferase 1
MGPKRAAAIQRALSGHGMAEARRAVALRPGMGLALAVSGLGPRSSRRWARGLGADWVALQGQGRLGWRLQRQLNLARRQGAQRVVLIGSDLPELAAADLVAAFDALARCDVVLGPAADGGYWLIGLAGRWPRLFAGGLRAIAWGSDQVLAQTLDVADQLGLVVTLLPIRHDLDRPGDLRRWR